MKSDKDADGLGDAQELAIGTNPGLPDSDGEGGDLGDGLTDLEELRLGTDPTRADSDGDGTRDGDEQEQGSDPFEDERSTLRKLVEGGSDLVLDHPFDFLIPTGAIRSGAAKGLSKAIEKAAPKLAGIRAAKDLKSLATLRRARAKAAEELSKAAQRAKASIKRADANQRGGLKPGVPTSAPIRLPAFSQSTIDGTVASSARLSKGGQVPEGARAITKKQGQGASPFQGLPPTQSQAESIIGDILRNPKVVDRGDRVFDAYDASGRGVRVRRDTGKFQGFLDLARRRAG